MVARDVAPSKCFEMVKSSISVEHKVISFLGHGKPIKEPIEHIIWQAKNSDVVLLGMSSSFELSKEERIVADCAIEKNIPYGFYADTYGTPKRIWFEEYCSRASFLFVVSENDAEESKDLYHNAKIVISGNPIRETYFSLRHSRKNARKILSISDDDTMVLCPVGKDLVSNILHFGAVIEALHGISDRKFKIFFTLHPGDLNPPSMYEDLIKYSKIPVLLKTKEEIISSDMIPAADIVIDLGSDIGVEAACQRIPVISYFSYVRLGELVMSRGNDELYLAKIGAALQINKNFELLRTSIISLLSDSSKMREQQKKAFPVPPEKGAAVRKIIETLLLQKQK